MIVFDRHCPHEKRFYAVGWLNVQIADTFRVSLDKPTAGRDAAAHRYLPDSLCRPDA